MSVFVFRPLSSLLLPHGWEGYEYVRGGAGNVRARKPICQGFPQGAQSNRISLGWDFRQVIEVPARLFALGFDTDYCAAFVLEDVQNQVSYHRQAMVGVSRSKSPAFLVESHIRNPAKPPNKKLNAKERAKLMALRKTAAVTS